MIEQKRPLWFRYLDIIGDIHGCINTLRKLINQLSPEQSDQIIFLGDYVNKGPDSLAVIEEIISLTDKFSVFCLLGNHDKLLLDVLVNDSDKILRNKLSELTNDDFFKLSTKDQWHLGLANCLAH